MVVGQRDGDGGRGGGGGKENGEEEEGEGGGGEGGEGEHVGDVGTLRGVQLCLLSPLLPIHSGAASANQFNAKEKEIKQKHILKANISLQNILQGSTHSTSYLPKVAKNGQNFAFSMLKSTPTRLINDQ